MDQSRHTIQGLHRKLTKLLDALAAEEVTVTVGRGGLIFRGDGIESGRALVLMQDTESLYRVHPVSMRTMLKARRGS